MQSLKSRIALVNINHGLRQQLGNSRSLWVLLAGMLCLWNTALLWLSHATGISQCINFLLWCGIFITLEDKLPSLAPRPSKVSAFLGFLLLTLTILRGSLIIHQYDKYLSLSLPSIALGLCLVNRPIGGWKLFLAPLSIASLGLALPVVNILLERSLANVLPDLSAFLVWLLLYSLGVKTVLSGTKVLLGSGGIDVFPPCAGFEQIIFSLAIVVIFLIAFPLRKKISIFALLAFSVPIAILCNVLRLALLAYFTSWSGGAGRDLFLFFHDSHGSLIFSLISGAFVGHSYLLVLERELVIK